MIDSLALAVGIFAETVWYSVVQRRGDSEMEWKREKWLVCFLRSDISFIYWNVYSRPGGGSMEGADFPRSQFASLLSSCGVDQVTTDSDIQLSYYIQP